MTKLVYLSGPIGGLTYKDATNWREYVSNCLPSKVHSLTPMRGKEGWGNPQQPMTERPGIVNCDSRSITMRDRWDVQRCDAMLVHIPPANWTRFSTGTTVEIGWADAFRVPIVLACERGAAFTHWFDHPIIKGCVGWHVETLDEAIVVLSVMFREEKSNED